MGNSPAPQSSVTTTFQNELPRSSLSRQGALALRGAGASEGPHIVLSEEEFREVKSYSKEKRESSPFCLTLSIMPLGNIWRTPTVCHKLFWVLALEPSSLETSVPLSGFVTWNHNTSNTAGEGKRLTSSVSA